MEAIIIGGVAAGMSAASKLKRTLPQARIRVYERGNFLSYGACGIPYYVGGINADPDLLIARSREDFEKQGIEYTFLSSQSLTTFIRRSSSFLNSLLTINIVIVLFSMKIGLKIVNYIRK